MGDPAGAVGFEFGLSRDVRLRELHAMLSHVRRWAARHSTRVRRCLAVQRDDQIAVFVVPRSGRYDFDLSDLLTGLDLELAEQFRACPCDVLQMPYRSSGDAVRSAGTQLSVLVYDEVMAGADASD